MKRELLNWTFIKTWSRKHKNIFSFDTLHICLTLVFIKYFYLYHSLQETTLTDTYRYLSCPFSCTGCRLRWWRKRSCPICKPWSWQAWSLRKTSTNTCWTALYRWMVNGWGLHWRFSVIHPVLSLSPFIISKCFSYVFKKILIIKKKIIF